jgi:hypothetical protein
MVESNATEFKFVHKNNLRLILGVSLVMIFLSILVDIRPVIFFAGFCVLSAFFMIYERFVQMPVDFELFTFSTILMTLKFGLIWGLVTAVSTKMAAVFYNKDFNRNTLFSISSYVVAALSTHLLHTTGMNLVILGLIVIFLTNIYNFFVFRFVVQMDKYELMLYGGTNFLFNFVMIMGFFRIFMGLMLLI